MAQVETSELLKDLTVKSGMAGISGYLLTKIILGDDKDVIFMKKRYSISTVIAIVNMVGMFISELIKDFVFDPNSKFGKSVATLMELGFSLGGAMVFLYVVNPNVLRVEQSKVIASVLGSTFIASSLYENFVEGIIDNNWEL